MAESQKSTMILITICALIVGYAGYTGDGINMVGMEGMRTRMARVDSMKDTLVTLQA